MRQRITWRKANVAQPAAMPSEAGQHPAAQPEPDSSAYENGDTSSWAEDPKPGPYTQPGAPAMPTEAGDHPAARKAAERKAQRKAAKCIRVAEVLLGRKASVSMIEDQAYDLMSLPDEALDMTLERMTPSLEDFDEPSDVFASSDEDEEAEKMLAEMLKEQGKSAASDDEDEEAEKMLAEMLEEEDKAKKAEDSEDDDDSEVAAILAELEKEEEEGKAKEAAEEEPKEEEDTSKEACGDDMAYDVDPLGLDPEFEDDLSKDLFASEEKPEAPAPAKEASRSASLKTPKSLKTVVASAKPSDPTGLEALWTTAPNVASHFGM